MASLSLTSVSFGQVILSSSVSPVTLTFTASASSNYTASFTGDDAAQFTLSAAMSSVALVDEGTQDLYVNYLDTEVGTHSATLDVTDSDGNSVATCSLTGQTIASDEPWNNGSSTVAFGTVDVGSSSLGAVTINSMEDSDTYTYTCALETGAEFECSVTSTQTADGGVALSMTLTFTPGAAESYEDTLTISWSRTSGDPTSGTIEVTLTGTGVEDTDDTTDDDTDDWDGNLQRATLSVPSYSTIVNLGEAYSEEATRLTQTGFTATTTRNVFFKAAKSVTVQAEGHAWFQSTDDTAYMMSGGKTYMIADQTMYLTGGTYLGIMAGYGASVTEKVSYDDDGNPESPSSATDVNTGFMIAEIAWQVSKKLTTVYSIVKTIFDKKLLDDPISKAKILGLNVPVGKIKAVLGVPAMVLFLGATVAQFIYGRVMGSDLHTVSMFSEAGFNAGTPAFTTVAGTLGTTTFGLNVTMIGYAHLTLEGVWSASMDTFGDAAVIAGKDISAITGWGSHTVASRMGAFTATGSTVKVGTLTPDGRQAPTLDMTIDAFTKLGFEALAPGVGVVEMSGMLGVSYDSVNEISFITANNATVGYPLAYRIEATPGGITISNPAGPVLQLKPGTIIIGPAAGSITLGPSVANIGNAITITPTLAACNAPAVDLL